MMEHFLRGRLVLLEQSLVVDIRPYVEALIRGGYHKSANFGKGLSASAYRKMWPREVLIPKDVAERGFVRVLLVDQTISIPDLVSLGGFQGACVAPEQPFPHLPIRYIAFLRFSEHLERSAQQWREIYSAEKAFDTSELHTRESLFIPLHYRSILLGKGLFLSLRPECGYVTIMSRLTHQESNPTIDYCGDRISLRNFVSVQRMLKVVAVS